MVIRCRKFVLLLALAVMPLQGMAATLAVLFCHGDAQAHATHAAASHAASHDHGEHAAADASRQSENGSAEGSEDSAASYHLCCNLTVSASTSMSVDPALPDFPVQAFVPAPLHGLFVPEQPQRPPLA
jgi:hypothetical protein